MVSNRKKNKNGTFKNIKGCQIAKRKKKTKKKRHHCASSTMFVFAVVLPWVVLPFVTAVRGAAGRCDAAGCGCWSLLREVMWVLVAASQST